METHVVVVNCVVRAYVEIPKQIRHTVERVVSLVGPDRSVRVGAVIALVDCSNAVVNVSIRLTIQNIVVDVELLARAVRHVRVGNVALYVRPDRQTVRGHVSMCNNHCFIVVGVEKPVEVVPQPVTMGNVRVLLGCRIVQMPA